MRTGDTVYGEWKDDAANGWVTINYSNGMIYCGDCINGIRCGEGQLSKLIGEVNAEDTEINLGIAVECLIVMFGGSYTG